MNGMTFEWATTEDTRCVATCFMRDDRWGKLPNRCERVLDHDGPHASGMRACEPLAALVWEVES